MDITGFTSLFDSVKAVKDVVKAASDMKTNVAINEKATEIYSYLNDVQEKLMALQIEHMTMARLKDDLERQVVQLTEWNQDKQHYALTKLPSGALVYQLKPAYQGDEPVHQLCPNCYQKQVKSIIQFHGYSQWHSVLKCPNCSAEFFNERQDMKCYSVGRRSSFDTDDY
ncbi:TPA: hypothetical protein MHQ07_03285 [Klebsiella pneumoniae subsp. pneumoniae]|uniref:hypothetical protein n=1 Tax=Klebsiella TaxID=570 RepID=UPI0005910A4D|nr:MULTISPECIES: hypothetical protein [Klebsiella]HBX1747872.1 hypothetical protein [Klebsiella pneumoniae subsp. pneumoniae]SXJ56579.1 Uncharacterised protein [Klebsiella pneumoniae]SXP56247.1 Uncharacterised protein [Klebsiella pneumoniae]HBR7873733.1 hypothetical protein [Klebsiella pneumoniae]HBS7109468.1 hypothetical protein [Klebsiella pneumoniae]